MLLVKIMLVLFVMVGVAVVVPQCVPSTYNTAFSFAGMSFSWLILICVGVGAMVFKKVK